MKKIIVLVLLIASIAFANKAKAQFNYIGGGIVVADGAKYEYNELPYFNNSFGIDLRASYKYSKKLKIVPDLNIYLPNKESFVNGGESKVTVFAFNLNAHYILNSRSRDNYRLYLLTGAHVGGWNIKDDRVTSIGSITALDIKEFKIIPGGNVGGGMQFKLANRMLFFAEIKYVIAKTNQLVFSPGILYEF